MRLLALALAAVVLIPAAAAGGGAFLTLNQLSNHADPSLLRVNGGVLVAYDVESTGSINVIDTGATTHTVVAGWAAVSDPQLVRKPDGTIFLYFGGSTADLKTQGALRFASIDGGASWSGPVKTNAASTIGDAQASALRRDGTPLFTQDGTGFINVYQGDNGGTVHNAFNLCCGYDESLAVDTSGLAQLALWSNASGKSGYLYETLDATGAPTGAPLNLSAGTDAQAQPGTNRVPCSFDLSRSRSIRSATRRSLLLVLSRCSPSPSCQAIQSTPFLPRAKIRPSRFGSPRATSPGSFMVCPSYVRAAQPMRRVPAAPAPTGPALCSA